MRALIVLCVLGMGATGTAALGQGQGQGQGKGQDQVQQGGPGGTASCAACHGAQGEGNAQGGFPRLAGQSADYLLKQLDAYADGKRENAVMSPIARQMSPQERASAAAMYAGMQPRPGKAQKPAAQSPSRGRTLATIGDHKLKVQACANCHGPEGAGVAAIPSLAGQPLGYLVASLQQWKSGIRQTDPSQQMPAVAKALSGADIQAVARYYAGLPAPQGMRTAQPARPGTAAQGTQASPPAGSKPPAAGVDQGAPTRGGATGPGGASTNAPGKEP